VAVPGIAVLLTACGPGTSLKAGLSPVDLNVRLGSYGQKPTPQPPQAPPLASVDSGFPQPFVPSQLPPLPSFAATPGAPPQPACPPAPPFAFPALAAEATPSKPPVAGVTYAYRYAGSYTGKDGKAVPYPASGTRTVTDTHANEVAGDGGYDLTITEHWNGYTTATTYHVVRNGQTPPGVPAGGQAPAGMYLTQQQWNDPDPSSSPQVFQPNPSILVMSFPAQPGAPVGGHGADPAHGASETVTPSGQGPADQGYSQLQSPGAATPTPAANLPQPSRAPAPPGSSIVGTDRVDACGAVLDAWRVELIGQYSSAALGTYSFDDTYWFATQFGGLPVAEHHKGSGTRTDGSAFAYDVTLTINQVPR
jgi:hypothetical protein